MTNRKRILYTATSDIHIQTFHIPYLKWLKSAGLEIHLAVENRGGVNLDFCDYIHYVTFSRTPFHFRNIGAYVKLRELIDKYQFSIIHCHTPAISVLTRLAAISARKRGARVLYTAHGFHFFKGAPVRNWILYYPVEKILSAFTDGIITINSEDYEMIRSRFWNKHSFKINGIGVDSERFKPISSQERLKLRSENHLQDSDFVLIYVAEFIPRKNHAFLIAAMPYLREKIPNLKLLLVGQGSLLPAMKRLAVNLGVDSSIYFLGWRDDVAQLSALADIGVSSSKQEGLGLGLAEEMLCSIPVVASIDRGHREMVEHGKNGYLFRQGDTSSFVDLMVDLYNDRQKRLTFGKCAYEKAQKFLLSNSLNSMQDIYLKFLAA